MPKVIAIVGARLNSSRLPRKHFLDLAGKPLIARIFERLEQAPEIDEIILATTADAYNQDLVDWAVENQKKVFPYDGDVNDLIGRMDAIVRARNPEALVYVCGDSPLIEPQTLSRLIQSLFAENAEAAYVTQKDGRASIHEGFDVYSVGLWKQLVQFSQASHEREHVGAGIKSLYEDMHKAMIVDEPVYYEREHRLSVDTPSDYRFMSEVYDRWYATHPSHEIVSLPQVISWLNTDQRLRAMNSEVQQKTATDRYLSVLMVTAQGQKIGLGHLARTMAASRALQDTISAGVRLLVHGPVLEHKDLRLLPHQFSQDLPTDLKKAVLEKPVDVVVVDLHPSLVHADLLDALECLSQEGVKLVSIDFTLPESLIHLNWIPSFYIRPGLQHMEKHRYGWDCFLLGNPAPEKRTVPATPTIAVLSGGSDVYGMGQILPALLDAQLPEGAHIHWIQGPYAPAPVLPHEPRLTWHCAHNPENLPAILSECSHALTVYGVSFFECLALGLGVVVVTPNQDPNEMAALAASHTCQQFKDPARAVTALAELVTNPCQNLQKRALKLLDGKGPTRLARAVQQLVQPHNS